MSLDDFPPPPIDPAEALRNALAAFKEEPLDEGRNFAAAAAWALVSLAASNLVPTPDEILAAVDQVVSIEHRDAVERLAGVEEVIDLANQRRRDPAFVAALQIIRAPLA